MKSLPRPTDSELAILRVLWRRGPCTVREVHDLIGKSTVYTTILKLMQIMRDKGLVVSDDTARAHVFSAALQEDETQKQLVADLLERAFGGSTQKLVQHALAGSQPSQEEIRELKCLLKTYERKQP